MLEGNTRRARKLRSVCVFCGSSSGFRREYGEAAAQFGIVLARSETKLIFGGGRVGLMGMLADSVLGAGGKVVGVMPRDLVEKEIAHTGLTELRVVESMHARKAMMSELADAFVLLPGGFGSWEEFCEVVTWLQLGMHKKPCGILNVAGYYDALLSLASHAVEEGFLLKTHAEMLIVENDCEHLLSRLAMASAPSEIKWITANET